MRWPWQKKHLSAAQFETVLQRLIAIQYGTAGKVTPENCLRSPTVFAIHTAITGRFAVTPVHVYKTSIDENGLEKKEKIPDHDAARLLKKPNDWQTKVDYWQDLASSLVRYNKFVALKGQGNTGPIRNLFPLNAGQVKAKQESEGLSTKISFQYGADNSYPLSKIHYIRGPAKDFLNPESPVDQVSNAIAIEIACEEHGLTFFANGAIPLKEFFYKDTHKGFKTPQDEKDFIEDFQNSLSGANKHRAMLLPKGIESRTDTIDNEKAQFLETRQFYQTVIAGAWGVPPHLVGNLMNAHYNNVENQDKEFDMNVMLRYFTMSEASMERDLLSEKDRQDGIIIRFNVDATLRATFKERQEGLEIQKRNGVINADEWREIEGKNPRKNGGSDYYYSANLIQEGQVPASRTNANPQTTQTGN